MPKTILLKELLAVLGISIFEYQGDGKFSTLAESPGLGQKLLLPAKSKTEAFSLPEHLVFLRDFVLSAEVFWQDSGGTALESGPWVEPTENGEIYLEATALAHGNRRILLLKELGESFAERQNLLQKAREESLTLQLLAKEVQKKEILLHCIVHDLAGPLTGIKSLFSLLGREELSEKARRRLAIGREAADKLEQQIRTTLDVFSAELETLESFFVDAEKAPDLADCLRNVVEILLPAAALKEVELQVEPPLEGGGEWKVVGERSRLERVLFNLLENAIRFAPPKAEVRVHVLAEASQLRVQVDDTGPGVPPDEVSGLFRKFFQGSGTRGKAGLGLYFCRIVVERWGGKIGYQPLPEGGARFWFQLPRAQAGDSRHRPK